MTTILITGVNRGIGLALARAALEKGWTTYGSVRSIEQAAEITRLLNSDNFHALIFDVTAQSEVDKAANAFTEPLDILINNAGIMGPDGGQQSTANMDFGGFTETLAVNTLAPLRISQAFLPALRKSSAGRILTISSLMSWMGYTKSTYVAYRTSKSAVNKVMQCLSTDLAPENIPVALIDPGWVKTDMGSQEADLEVGPVAKGIIEIAGRLDMPMTGKFYEWSGEEREF